VLRSRCLSAAIVISNGVCPRHAPMMLTRLKMAFTCMKIHHTANAVFSPFIVFAKAQGIVKAKHRFLVQHARYS
jgi:hypothetical protein